MREVSRCFSRRKRTEGIFSKVEQLAEDEVEVLVEDVLQSNSKLVLKIIQLWSEVQHLVSQLKRFVYTFQQVRCGMELLLWPWILKDSQSPQRLVHPQKLNRYFFFNILEFTYWNFHNFCLFFLKIFFVQLTFYHYYTGTQAYALTLMFPVYWLLLV